MIGQCIINDKYNRMIANLFPENRYPVSFQEIKIDAVHGSVHGALIVFRDKITNSHNALSSLFRWDHHSKDIFREMPLYVWFHVHGKFPGKIVEYISV